MVFVRDDDDGPFQVRLHPADAEAVAQSGLPRGRPVLLDADVEPGKCRIRSIIPFIHAIVLFPQKFHNVCYKVEERRELLSAINEFLDESVVLPPGDWDSKNLLSIEEIQEMRRRRKDRKAAESDHEKVRFAMCH